MVDIISDIRYRISGGGGTSYVSVCASRMQAVLTGGHQNIIKEISKMNEFMAWRASNREIII